MRTWAIRVSSLSVSTPCYPQYFFLASGAGVPWRSKSLSSTCPGPRACCTCPSPHSQPRWSLPGQLSCLPHGSVAPRTGPQENPAGQGASKQGSSWDAWGHWGWMRWSFHEDLESLHMWGRARSPRTGTGGGQPETGNVSAPAATV